MDEVKNKTTNASHIHNGLQVWRLIHWCHAVWWIPEGIQEEQRGTRQGWYSAYFLRDPIHSRELHVQAMDNDGRRKLRQILQVRLTLFDARSWLDSVLVYANNSVNGDLIIHKNHRLERLWCHNNLMHFVAYLSTKCILSPLYPYSETRKIIVHRRTYKDRLLAQ